MKTTHRCAVYPIPFNRHPSSAVVKMEEFQNCSLLYYVSEFYLVISLVYIQAVVSGELQPFI